MNVKRSLSTVIGGFVLMMSIAGIVLSESLPLEPTDKYLVNEDVNMITGLYTRECSHDRNGIVDYKTARQIIISEYNEYWNSVVQTKEFPLFYWYDAQHHGQFAMWVDQKVEGCRCDIIPYQVMLE